MLVSDPSFPFPLSFILLLPPAAVSAGLFAGVGRMSLPLAWMNKREFTITQTVAIKMSTNFRHGAVA